MSSGCRVFLPWTRDRDHSGVGIPYVEINGRSIRRGVNDLRDRVTGSGGRKIVEPADDAETICRISRVQQTCGDRCQNLVRSQDHVTGLVDRVGG